MALFTDGPVSTIEDLTGQDSQLFDVANNEGIDVGRKLALAQEEIGLELNALLDGDTSNVVVTPALKMWHTFRALEMVYRDAYNNQLNDRYAGKRDTFHGMAKWAYEKLVQLGVGLVFGPVARAATPEVETAEGNLAGGTYYVTTAWVNEAGQEGAYATPAVVTTARCSLRARPGNAPRNATGWNVYVGDSESTMTLQNDAPFAAAQSWGEVRALKTSGRAPEAGQKPDYAQPVARITRRG
jgi:hypothetical protein